MIANDVGQGSLVVRLEVTTIHHRDAHPAVVENLRGRHGRDDHRSDGENCNRMVGIAARAGASTQNLPRGVRNCFDLAGWRDDIRR